MQQAQQNMAMEQAQQQQELNEYKLMAERAKNKPVNVNLSRLGFQNNALFRDKILNNKEAIYDIKRIFGDDPENIIIDPTTLDVKTVDGNPLQMRFGDMPKALFSAVGIWDRYSNPETIARYNKQELNRRKEAVDKQLKELQPSGERAGFKQGILPLLEQKSQIQEQMKAVEEGVTPENLVEYYRQKVDRATNMMYQALQWDASDSQIQFLARNVDNAQEQMEHYQKILDDKTDKRYNKNLLRTEYAEKAKLEKLKSRLKKEHTAWKTEYENKYPELKNDTKWSTLNDDIRSYIVAESGAMSEEKMSGYHKNRLNWVRDRAAEMYMADNTRPQPYYQTQAVKDFDVIDEGYKQFMADIEEEARENKGFFDSLPETIVTVEIGDKKAQMPYEDAKEYIRRLYSKNYGYVGEDT